MRGAYYNEFDPFAAEWLKKLIDKNLIAPGDVDTRSIKEVMSDDLRGYIQCHFFAGIGGWSRALRLAGWDDSRPVWNGTPLMIDVEIEPEQNGYKAKNKVTGWHEDTGVTGDELSDSAEPMPWEM